MNRADLPAKAHKGNPYNSTIQATRTQAQASTGDLRSQLVMRALLVLALATAGCASRPVEDVPALPPMEYFREVMVQTIPRGCWVEHNSGYVGVAPIVVRVRSSERGYPLGVNAITVQTLTIHGGPPKKKAPPPTAAGPRYFSGLEIRPEGSPC